MVCHAAFLVGILSIRATSAMITRLNATASLPEDALSSGGAARRRRRHSLKVAILVNLLDRYRTDDAFRSEIATRVDDLYEAHSIQEVVLPPVQSGPGMKASSRV